MLTSAELRLRDPFILPHDGTYYLYGTCMPDAFPGCHLDPQSLYCYTGTDLFHWDGPHLYFTIPSAEECWAKEELWAPEVHVYNGRFYLFVSIMGKKGLRGTQIAVGDSPLGPFVPVANRPATPLTQSCIDGTLFVENGDPYIVYSHDWPDNYIAEGNYYDGQICVQQLTKDLTAPVGEPFILFNSSEAPCSMNAPSPTFWEGRNHMRYGSDAPFIVRMADERLCLLWSPFPGNNYVVCVAFADSIRGEWTHSDQTLYSANGSHGMIFTGFDGVRRLCIHCPERPHEERATLLAIEEADGKLRVK